MTTTIISCASTARPTLIWCIQALGLPRGIRGSTSVSEQHSQPESVFKHTFSHGAHVTNTRGVFLQKAAAHTVFFQY